MTSPHYIIRGGIEGRERLRLLARVLRPTTEALLMRIGVQPGMRCLDAGCGGGDVTFDLARLVGPGGKVVGTDIDESKLALARDEAKTRGIEQVEFRHADLLDQEDETGYDLVYARFLLSHLPEPAGALAKFRRVLHPGGIIAVEDVNFSGHVWYPDSPAFRRYIDLYTQAAQRRGVDPNIGPRLPGLLDDTGLVEIGINLVQPIAREGDIKIGIPLTLEAIAPAVLADGLIDLDDLNRTVDELYAFARDPKTVMSFPRIVQAWGRQPAGIGVAGG